MRAAVHLSFFALAFRNRNPSQRDLKFKEQEHLEQLEHLFTSFARQIGMQLRGDVPPPVS